MQHAGSFEDYCKAIAAIVSPVLPGTTVDELAVLPSVMSDYFRWRSAVWVAKRLLDRTLPRKARNITFRWANVGGAWRPGTWIYLGRMAVTSLPVDVLHPMLFPMTSDRAYYALPIETVTLELRRFAVVGRCSNLYKTLSVIIGQAADGTVYWALVDVPRLNITATTREPAKRSWYGR